MSGTIWIKHPDLAVISEVPESALRQWRQAGWDLLSDEELAERERALAEESAAAEQWMRGFAENGLSAEAPAPAKPSEDVVKSSEGAVGRQAKKENG